MPRQADRIYIAGPMTGLPEFNYSAFHRAAEVWRKNGWDVLNPATHFGGRTDLPYERYMRAAVRDVVRAGAVALLPGWEESAGARLEVLNAERMGSEFFDAITGELITTVVPRLDAVIRP